MHAHATDFRAEVEQLDNADKLTAGLLSDWRTAGFDATDLALCAYAEKLTSTPAAMTAADLEELREAGLSEVALHDAVQVIAYFNYINRIADAVHVDLEPEMPPYPGPCT